MTISESEKLDLFRGGDRRVWREYYRRYKGRVAAIIIRRTSGIDPADQQDISAEVWLKAFRAAPGLRAETEAEFIGWISRITENQIRDYFSDRKRRSVIDAPVENENEAPLADASEYDRHRTSQTFSEFEKTLTDEEKAVMTEHFWNGSGYEQTAARLGQSRWQVKGKIREIRKKAQAFCRLQEVRRDRAEFLFSLSALELNVFEKYFVLTNSLASICRELEIRRPEAEEIVRRLRKRIADEGLTGKEWRQ